MSKKKKAYFYMCTLDQTPNKEWLFTFSSGAEKSLEQFLVDREPLGFGSYLATWFSEQDKKKYFKDRAFPIIHANTIADVINVTR